MIPDVPIQYIGAAFMMGFWLGVLACLIVMPNIRRR